MRAFVTGGGGFIGGELVRQLGYAPHYFEWGLRTVLEHMTGTG